MYHKITLFTLLLIFLLSACDTPASNPSVLTQKTPTTVLAGGEPILPHSQILFHDAPAPTSADSKFDNSEWTLEGFDAAATHAVSLPSCCQTSTPVPLWYHPFGTALLNAPVVGTHTIYQLAADGYLHILNSSTGEEQQRIPVSGELMGGPALSYGILYMPLEGHFLAALNTNTGKELWRFNTESVIHAASLVVGRIVLVTSGANSLFCVDALTGQEYWAFHSEDALSAFWPTQTSPAFANGLVYVALGAANEFNALNVRTGRKVWEAALHERMTGGPLLNASRGLVYIVTWSGRVLAFDTQTGRVRWETHLPAGSESSPALSQQLNTLYLGGYDGSLYALNADTGQLRWRLPMGSAITAAPLIMQTARQTFVIVASQNGTEVIANARNGAIIVSWQLGELRAEPVVAQGIVYQASIGKQGLFAFQL